MNLSRAKAANIGPAQEVAGQKKETPLDYLDFLENRDYAGALAILEFNKRSGEAENLKETLQWIGYTAFHLGDMKKSLETYQQLLALEDSDPLDHIYLGCCMFFLGMYKEAEEEVNKGPSTPLQVRLQFHLAHKLNDEDKLMVHHGKLKTTVADQLSLASIHYLRSHFQEATDIYKRVLLEENRDFLALNVYVALCYYKLDYYDVSLEVLQVYLQANPDSVVAVNLKACNIFRLYNGQAAEAELKVLLERSNSTEYTNDIVKHNLVVFRDGEGALQTLPPLVDVVVEARLNLVVYYLRNDEVEEAYNLIKDLEPSTPQEYILKGVVNASVGNLMDSSEHLKMAQQYFQLVGSSASECDTIPGRQCMASCFFLLRQFDDVMIYLKSVETYQANSDEFNNNYGMTKAALGQFAEAEENLLMVQNERYTSDYAYLAMLARCYIANAKPKSAWELYLRMETSNDSFSLLQLIANDCYLKGHFFYSAKAFDVLERLDPNPEYWEGKRGACVGVFQAIIAGKENREQLRDVVSMLRNTSNPQVEYIIRIMKKWARENGVGLHANHDATGDDSPGFYGAESPMDEVDEGGM